MELVKAIVTCAFGLGRPAPSKPKLLGVSVTPDGAVVVSAAPVAG